MNCELIYKAVNLETNLLIVHPFKPFSQSRAYRGMQHAQLIKHHGNWIAFVHLLEYPEVIWIENEW